MSAAEKIGNPDFWKRSANCNFKENDMMGAHETFSRVRSIHKRRRAPDVYSKGGDLAARSRIQEAGRSESAKTRAKAEGQALRLGPRLDFNRFRLFLLHLAGKLGIREALPGDLGNRQSEPLGIVHFLARVVPECLFVNISKQVIWLHADVSPMQPTLQQAPEVLHRVRVDIAPYVFYGVVDNSVLVIGFQTVIGLQCIAENCGTGFDALPDDWLKFLLGAGGYVTGDNLAAALYHPEHNLLAFRPASHDRRFALRLVPVAGLPTDKGFIAFNLAPELAAVGVLKAKANPMKHVPCALLGNLERPVDLPGTNAVLHAGLHPDRHQPLVQGDGGIFHDGSHFDRELGQRMAGLALPHAAGSNVANVLRPARGADHAVSPCDAMGHEVVDAVVEIIEVYNCLLEGLWFVVNFAHTSTLAWCT